MPRFVPIAAAAALLLPALARAQGARGDAVAHRGAAQRIDSLARAAVASGRVAGLAIVSVHRGDTVVARGYGRADVENDVAMTADHVFELASITKEFTAAAVLRLVAAGRVELDAPITRWIPIAPVQGRTVTVRQLLSHTGGVPDYAEQMGRFPGAARIDVPPESLLTMVRDVPPYFEPGTFMRYSNTGFALLGMLIEKVTGQPYGTWVRDSVLRPAGLASTRYCDHRAIVRHRARGYTLRPSGLENADYLSYSRPYSAGSFCGTAGDLARWNAALHGGRVLAPAQYAEMVRPATLASGQSVRYGLGVSVDRVAGRRAFHHGGDINGFTTWTAWLPDDSLSVTVLVNTQGPVRPNALGAAAIEAILGARPDPAVAFRGSLAALVGKYAEGVEFVAAGDTLVLLRPPLPRTALRFAGGLTFTDGSRLYRFEPAKDGVSPAVWADLGVSYVRWDRAPAR